ncbi:3-hydroxyisobutyrate dehydrogenase [Nocardia cyriacigeorgica]|uniref:3-hydroxyisobutyrate dehydrogenase n=1 Tax=Nocardia cyriacigeorgica TaxID=135487 RepID=UPI001893EFD0|nr:3-hydroxyisobutyrate dehydrogenase [Nocardia cyriacigeorgica]MBF6287977.1 3-hydroxyisobutyrate dehydrogenase [Nocardia cyriacigeorgica]MBF6427221.1 3-hydroxyisobutyrate dehydrogenase [Nocardia cyriacigeorgica]
MATIAWIGLGHMGQPMTANLVAKGHTVHGFDLNADALAAAAATGVKPCESVAEAVRGVDAVFTMLPKGENVRAVYEGPDGVLAQADSSALLVDSSTIDIDTAAALHEMARERGFRFVDAPVSGGISGAAAATLTFMLGGEADAVEAAAELVEPMSRNIIRTGGATSGQAAKICNNMMLLINLAGCAEGAVLAQRLGLDPQVFWNVASVSSADSWALRTWYPVPGIVETSAANNGFDPTFAASLANKDIGLALRAGESTGTPLPTASIVAGQLQDLVDSGLGDRDCALIIKHIDDSIA